MNRLFALVAGAAVMLCCSAFVPVSDNKAPAIETGELLAYAHGNAKIVGSIKLTGGYGASVHCAPDTPYVEWYVHALGAKAVTTTDYDARMGPYTREVLLGNNGTFECDGLALEPYIVWFFEPQTVQSTHTTYARFVTTNNGAGMGSMNNPMGEENTRYAAINSQSDTTTSHFAGFYVINVSSARTEVKL